MLEEVISSGLYEKSGIYQKGFYFMNLYSLLLPLVQRDFVPLP